MKTKEQTINETKKVLKALLNCVKDKTISIEDRNNYYSEYLKLSKNLIILSR